MTYAETITRDYSDFEFYAANGNRMTEVTVTYTYPDAPQESVRVRFSQWGSEPAFMRIINDDNSVRMTSQIHSAVWARMRPHFIGGAISRAAVLAFYQD